MISFFTFCAEKVKNLKVSKINWFFQKKNLFVGVLYPDSVVGTDSHTTMINGLGVVGWGVGGNLCLGQF